MISLPFTNPWIVDITMIYSTCLTDDLSKPSTEMFTSSQISYNESLKLVTKAEKDVTDVRSSIGNIDQEIEKSIGLQNEVHWKHGGLTINHIRIGTVQQISQNPNKEMNRRELLNQPMRVQIAGLPHTVIISLSE